MDYDVAEHNFTIYGNNPDEEQVQEQNNDNHQPQFYSETPGDNVDDSAGHELNHSIDDSFAGKLFVGGIAWETNEEAFRKYFSKFGEIADAVIMMDKVSGRPRGFGFVTFADSEVANKVLEEDHVIDGRAVEVKRTVPREDIPVKGAPKTKKIFVGGLPISITEDELNKYFSSYGNVLEHQIMLDHTTGRSRGFGFVTFDSEDAVEKVLNDGRMHELHGKQVEIKRAEPKRGGGEHASGSRLHRGGSSSRSYSGFGDSVQGQGGGYGGRMDRGFGGYGGYDAYGGYGNFIGGYGRGAAGFYSGYGGYGYGFGIGGAMYGAAGYGNSSYGGLGSYGGASGYAGGKGYTSGGSSWYDGAKGFGDGSDASYGGAKGHGNGSSNGGAKAYGNGGAASGRFHPYKK